MELGLNSSVGEVAAASLAAVRILEDFGIDYCCGGTASLADACRTRGVDSQKVVEALRGSLEGTGTGERDWATEPLSALIHQIVSVHHEYLKLELPRLQKRLEAVYAAHGARDGAMLARVVDLFVPMKQELELHMHKEELMLFPAIEQAERMAKGGQAPAFPFGALRNPIRVMLAEHDSAGTALEQIRRITRNYELPPHACETYRALFRGIPEMERDLHMHIHLENNILFPRAIALGA